MTTYLKSIKKSNQTGNTHQLTENKDVEANYSKFLENASLKKEKLVVQVPKRAQEFDHPAAMSKKKRKEMAQKQKKLEAQKEASGKEEEEKVEVLYHHPEVLRNFDLIKIEPPNTQEDIDKIIGTLEEKCKYFFELRDKEGAEGEAVVEEEPEEKEEHPQEKRVTPYLCVFKPFVLNKQGGRGRKDEKRVDVNFDLNATDFPSFQ